jgi:hypothetical protein
VGWEGLARALKNWEGRGTGCDCCVRERLAQRGRPKTIVSARNKVCAERGGGGKLKKKTDTVHLPSPPSCTPLDGPCAGLRAHIVFVAHWPPTPCARCQKPRALPLSGTLFPRHLWQACCTLPPRRAQLPGRSPRRPRGPYAVACCTFSCGACCNSSSQLAADGSSSSNSLLRRSPPLAACCPLELYVHSRWH